MVVWQGGGSNGLHPGIFAKLWGAVCRPLMEYAAELWEGEAAKSWVTKFETLQNSFCRAVLKIKGVSFSTAALRAEMGLHTLESHRRLMKLRYWRRLCTADSSRLVSLVFRKRHQQGGAPQSHLIAMRNIMMAYGFGDYFKDRKCLSREEWFLDTAAAVDSNVLSEEATNFEPHFGGLQNTGAHVSLWCSDLSV